MIGTASYSPHSFLDTHHFDSFYIDSVLRERMALYLRFNTAKQAIICNYVEKFYNNKSIYIDDSVTLKDEVLILVAANAALLGAFGKLEYFNTIRWLYFFRKRHSYDDSREIGTTFYLNIDKCFEDSAHIEAAQNFIAYAFARAFDDIFHHSGSTQKLHDSFNLYLQQSANSVSTSDNSIDSSNPLLKPQSTDHFSLGEFGRFAEKEFFAFSTEAFFTCPAQLKQSNTMMYEELERIYGIDMASII